MRAFGKKPAGVTTQRGHQNRGYETLLILCVRTPLYPLALQHIRGAGRHDLSEA
jgi:hypothetical protein